MKQTINTLLLFFMLPISLSAQSPYEIDWKKERYILGIGAASFVNGLIINNQTKSLNLNEILSFDRANVNNFDRNATFKFSNNAAKASDVLLFSSFGFSSLLLMDTKPRSDFGKIMILYGEAITITGGLTYLTKGIVKRPRPYVYNELVNLSKKESKGARFSFFSGHTSLTATNCFFTAKVFSDYYPDSKLKPYVWIGASLVPAVTGLLRVEAGKHYFSDVITGYALGAIVGVMIPHLHKVQKNKPLSIYPGTNGAVLTWNFNH